MKTLLTLAATGAMAGSTLLGINGVVSAKGSSQATLTANDPIVQVYEGILQKSTNPAYTNVLEGQNVHLILNPKYDAWDGKEVRVTVQFEPSSNQFTVQSVELVNTSSTTTPTTPNQSSTSENSESSSSESTESTTPGSNVVTFEGVLQQSTDSQYTDQLVLQGEDVNLIISPAYSAWVGKQVKVTVKFLNNSNDFVVESISLVGQSQPSTTTPTTPSSQSEEQTEQEIIPSTTNPSVVTFEGVLQKSTDPSFTDKIIFSNENVNLILSSVDQSLVGKEVKITVQFNQGSNFHVLSIEPIQ